ncbi:probable glutamate receptor [Periophthalmus magnuspinnatus]|uniref:probable glutamate receptor n=1 Tax=Periophthalmus magnuspinnatus TaxID=409849 RepID=UPI00145B67BD|nr:probable glutamate receptor [Periophthalmus magnuspinnatus]
MLSFVVLVLAFMFDTRICHAVGTELRITTIKQEPFTISKGSDFEGFCMDLLFEVAKKVGFRYKVHLVKDGLYGKVDESGRWKGMIGEVIQGEADLAVAPLTVTAAREKAVGMTKPFMQTGISILLRRDSSENQGSFTFLAPFNTQTWVGLLVAYLGTAACMFLIARLSPCEWAPESDQNRFSVVHSLWYTVGGLTLQGAGPHPKSLSGRVVSSCWWIFTLFLLAHYFTNLSSSNAAQSSSLTVKGFDDLANQEKMEYGCLAGSSTLAFFKNSNNMVYRRIYEHMERRKSFVSSMDEGVRRAKEGNYAFIGESVSLDMAAAHHCELVRSHEVIGMRGYSFAAPIGFPLLKNLSVAILELSEAGELAYLRSKWWPSHCLDQDQTGTTQGPLQGLRGLFLLLSLGLGLGLLLALLELTAHSRTRASEQKKSCCSVLVEQLSLRFMPHKAIPQETSDNKKDQP